MNPLNKPLSEAIQAWKTALPAYSEDAFQQKPHDEAWSIGQVYAHLTDATRFFHMRMILGCLQSSEGGEVPASDGWSQMKAAGSFPPIRIKVPPSPQYTPRQPENVAVIAEKLNVLEADLLALGNTIAQTPQSGKQAHPRLGALDAQEWFQLIEMHFRHHLRQKANLDQWLAGGEYP